MKDSTALILSSLVFNALTIVAVLVSAPISSCVALIFFGASLLGLGFYNLSNDN
jgi:hypothetical protein